MCSNDCNCSLRITDDKFITHLINTNTLICINEKVKGNIKTVFKHFNDRNDTLKYTEVKSPPFFLLIRINFICKVKLSSVLIKGEFTEIKFYVNSDVDSVNIKGKKEVDCFGMSNVHINEIGLKNSKYRDCVKVSLLLNGSENSKLFYISFKGEKGNEMAKAVATKYEARSSENIMCKDKGYSVME